MAQSKFVFAKYSSFSVGRV